MLVFIDDSGDPGFKLNKGSSEIFVIACVVFDDDLEAEKASVAIKEFRRNLKFPDSVEFKFNKSQKEVRKSFLRTIIKFNFQVRCLIITKKLIRSKELINNKNSFYSYAIKSLLQHSNNYILDAKVRIDGSGDKVFRRNFLAYLRKELNTTEKRVMKNCQFVDSKSNVLVQLADMVAGSIRRSYDYTKIDSQVYKQIIKNKIVDEWVFK